jgi:hypothetical protein
MSRDSSVGIALGYGLEDRGSMVPFPAGAGNFSLHHRVQTGSGAHPASYTMGNGGVMGEWRYSSTHSWPRNWMEVSGQLHGPACLCPGKEPLVPIG